MSRVSEFVNSVPLATRLIVGTCLALYVYCPLIYDTKLPEYTICPWEVIYKGSCKCPHTWLIIPGLAVLNRRVWVYMVYMVYNQGIRYGLQPSFMVVFSMWL